MHLHQFGNRNQHHIEMPERIEEKEEDLESLQEVYGKKVAGNHYT